jgi:hypothetical protein
VKRRSQNARILDLLSDGRFHSHHELYAIGCVAHSRIAELRARGHEIEQRRKAAPDGPYWEYRLISSPARLEHSQPAAQPQAETARLACVAGSGDALAVSQLRLFEAA